MRFPQWLFGIVYLISGLLFAFHSAPPHGGSETRWGFALTGIACLVIGAKFLGMPLKRDSSTGKAGKPDPFE